MISKLNSSVIRTVYMNNSVDNKEVSKNISASISSEGKLSKVEKIKESLEFGEYKINLQVLSEKIADELL